MKVSNRVLEKENIAKRKIKKWQEMSRKNLELERKRKYKLPILDIKKDKSK